MASRVLNLTVVGPAFSSSGNHDAYAICRLSRYRQHGNAGLGTRKFSLALIIALASALR